MAGGQRMTEEFPDHESVGPAPTITIEQFRERFTDQHRNAIVKCIAGCEKGLIDLYMEAGLDRPTAQGLASRDIYVARYALQIIHEVHPESFKW